VLELLVIGTTEKTCSLTTVDAGQDRIEEIRGERGRNKRAEGENESEKRKKRSWKREEKRKT